MGRTVPYQFIRTRKVTYCIPSCPVMRTTHHTSRLVHGVLSECPIVILQVVSTDTAVEILRSMLLACACPANRFAMKYQLIEAYLLL